MAEIAAPGTANRREQPIATAKLRSRPYAYTLIVTAALVAAFGLHVRRDGVLACPAGGYAGGAYLANCNASDYGEYDHAAFWYGLQPKARASAAAADVLFIGNSRLQYGFSTPTTDEWFAERDARYFLLGFAYHESVGFTGPLLEALEPRARAYVINVDQFFREDASIPANEVMKGTGVHRRMLIKAAWQPLHALVCTTLSPLCGDSPATYRRMDTGQWRLLGRTPRYPIEPVDFPVDPEQVARAQAVAEPFIASLPVDRRCVVLTYVWTLENDRANAEALASALGVAFVSPRLEGLTTYDGSHLDRASAERFSQAFFTAVEPHLAPCLSEPPLIADADAAAAPDVGARP